MENQILNFLNIQQDRVDSGKTNKAYAHPKLQ